MTSPLRIALLGGIPPSLGGGGLEVQMDRTASALRLRDHDVFHVARESAAREFDLLHAFGAEPDVWQALQHWRRSPAPLVVSAVTVTGSRAEEQLLRIGARIPLRSLAQRMRAEVLRAADVVVALTEHEAALLHALGARRIEVVPNGVDVVGRREGTNLPSLPDGFVLLLGTVNRRKRQAEAVAALGGSAVIAGGFEGTPQERARFEATVAAAGAEWLGEVDAVTAHDLLRRARALVHMSGAETQPLVMLEALAYGTPVVATRLPAARELAARHPGWVRIVASPSELPGAIEVLATPPGPPPAIPSWADVATRLEEIYRSVSTPLRPPRADAVRRGPCHPDGLRGTGA
jgi:glycosyltransferase involved in cell wall biosynthesis